MVVPPSSPLGQSLKLPRRRSDLSSSMVGEAFVARRVPSPAHHRGRLKPSSIGRRNSPGDQRLRRPIDQITVAAATAEPSEANWSTSHSRVGSSMAGVHRDKNRCCRSGWSNPQFRRPSETDSAGKVDSRVAEPNGSVLRSPARTDRDNATPGPTSTTAPTKPTRQPTAQRSKNLSSNRSRSHLQGTNP